MTCTGAGGTSPAASATVTVSSAGTPDLIVTSITSSPANPAAGQAVTFSAVAKNQGTAATPAGTILGVLFSVDGAVSNWSDTNTTSLAAGASVTLTANGGPTSATWSATAGTHTILANVDDVNRITESNESNNTFSTSLTVAAPDTTPPSTPAGLTATAVSSSQINLSWTASTDNVGVTGYKIFRDGVQVGTSATNSFSNTGLAASTVYSYTVSANDAAGNNCARQPRLVLLRLSAGSQSIAVGSRVVTTANLNVRQSASASATKLGTESIGALGTVVGGPTSAGGYTWWQVNYDNAISGWSISTYLLPAAANASPAVGMAQPTNGSFTLIQQLLKQVQALSLQLQSLQSQMAGAGATLGN